MIIALSGKARSGKDTFGEMLAAELYELTRKKFVLMAYAHELKCRVQSDFDLSYEQLWGEDKEKPDVRYIKEDGSHWTSREILQAYGQFFRTIDSDFWVKHLFNTIEEKDYKNVIITDARHVNEVAPLAQLSDGYIVRVARADRSEIHGSQHVSETALDGYDNIDFEIDNNGSLNELRQKAKATATMLLRSSKRASINNKGDL